jgi:prepilin-type N-terminal cleavage/methylation domain-containing protein
MLNLKKGNSWLAALHSNRGFTLIEVLMVITLSVIISLAAAGLFYATLVGSSRKNVETSLKDEGDYATSQIEFLLRNAIAVVATPGAPDPTIKCQPGMTALSLQSIDGGITTFQTLDSRIASVAAAPAIAATRYLTSSSVNLSNLRFNCQKSSTGKGTFVEFSFELNKTAPDLNNATGVNEVFGSGVSLRNY